MEGVKVGTSGGLKNVCTVALYVRMFGCVCMDMYVHWQGK